MQGGVGDDDAADRDRLELGEGGERAGAADVDLDRLHNRHRPLGGKLVRDRPAGRARDESEPLLQRKIVDLVDDAVDVVAERGALSLDRVVVREHLGGRMAELGQRVGRQAEAAHGFDGAELRRGERLADLAPGVSEEGERPACGDARVELAQRARGEVARIGVDRLSRLRLAGVERGEIGMAHVDLAARLENPRRAFEPVRDRLNRAHVGGHVLALVAVAARRRPHEFAVLVAQIAGEPVDLRLGDEVERRAVAQTQKAPHPGAELLDFLIGEDVAERQHRDRVANLGEFLRRRRPDLAIGGIGAGERGKRLLERGIAPAQFVIFRVGNRRRVLAVVAPVVLGDLGPEARVFGPRLGEGEFGLRLLLSGHRASVAQGG